MNKNYDDFEMAAICAFFKYNGQYNRLLYTLAQAADRSPKGWSGLKETFEKDGRPLNEQLSEILSRMHLQ